MTRDRRFLALGVLASLTLGGAAALVQAAPVAPASQVVVSGRAANIADEQRALREAKGQAARAHALSRRMDARAARARAEADKLNAQAAALIAIIDRLRAAQQTRLAVRQGPLIRLTAALQSLSRRPPALALVRPGSLTDTIHARAALATVLPAIARRTAALRAELAKTQRLQSLAVQTGAALRASRDRLATHRAALAALETRQRTLARGLASGASDEAERAMAAGERARDIDELMAAIAHAGDVGAHLAALPEPEPRPGSPTAPDTAPVAPAAYRLPVAGTLVTGMGELSDSGVRARGITLATAPDAAVSAPADGRIAWAGPYKGFGQIVIIDHGDGWTSLLTDLGRLSVRAGETVRQGAPLGRTRSGNHPAVTVELRRRGRPIDLVALATLP